MPKIIFLHILLVIICLTSCINRQSMSLQHNLSVNWELISNTYSDQTQAKAVFTISNDSKNSLKPSEWTMYFNMAPRIIIPSADSALADIIQISGDWYKLVPRKNTVLQPGTSVALYYEFQGWQIKESDAPTGLYFVSHDYRNREEIILPHRYTITPFTREEQMRRSRNDYEPLPTAEYRYYTYQKNYSEKVTPPLPLIPSPFQIEINSDTFVLDDHYSIVYDPELQVEAELLAKKLRDIAGLNLQLLKSPETSGASIVLISKPVTVNGNKEESYYLRTESGEITITGSKTGVFYGIQSLLNLIPSEVYKDKPGQIELPSLRIEDAPRFQYRGLHIDVCRNFQTKEQILKILDLMAFYKLNVLNLYLAEDEGWRLEIEELPELTEIGSKRGHTLDEKEFLHPSYGSGPFPDSENNYGTGYYTRNDFKEIIQYAYEQHITVIPAFNLPSHARAAIKAMEVRFNRFMAEDKITEANEYRLIDQDDRSKYISAQYYTDNVVCIGRESVYHFFETVIDNIIKMYREAGVPITTIHTGGDEVPEGAWTKSPFCFKLLAEHPEIGGPEYLQQYYFGRITEILSERNLKAGGWEEVALAKDKSGNYSVNPEFTGGNVIPYVWNNLGGSLDLSYRMANAGYPVVLCPVTNFYFDLAYNNNPAEPGQYWGGFIDERKPCEFAPFNMFVTTTETSMGEPIDIEKEYAGMERLKSDASTNILGLQAQLWHETIRGGEMMEYYLLPKLISFAERCWAKTSTWENISDREEREKLMALDWNQFSYILYNRELPRLSYLNGGYNYRIPPAGFIIEDGYLKANAVNQELVIRCTSDGTDPSNDSPIYSQPLPVEGIIKLCVFDKAGHSSRVITNENL